MDIQELLRHRPFVRALARSLVKDEARADDLVQQTWLTAIEKPPRHARSLRAWLGAVVRNLARSQNRAEWRRRKRERDGPPGHALPTPAEALEKAAWHQKLVEAVMELEEPYRTTVLLRYFEDLDSNQIGEAQGVPAATVRTRLRRALAQLRGRLDETTEGGRATWVPALVLLARPPVPSPVPGPAPAPASAGWLTPAVATGGLIAGLAGLWLVASSLLNSGHSPGRSDRRASDPPPAATREAMADPEPVVLPRPAIGHRLSVLVLEDGRPVGGAAVAVFVADEHPWRDAPTGPWKPVRRSVTHGDGQAWFSELPAGYARVAAWFPGRARATGHAFLPLALEYPVVLELRPEDRVELEVVDAETGAPIPDAWIGCTRDPAPDAVRTDVRGRARIPALAPGDDPRARVAAAGYVDRATPARAGRVELEPADRVVRWPLLPPLPPDGTAVELRRDGAAGSAFVEAGVLVARGLPRGSWPEHEAWAPGPLVARLEAERGAVEGPPVRFAEPRWLLVTLHDDEPVTGLALRLEDPRTGQPLAPPRTDGRFLRIDERPVRLAYRERGASRWRPLRDVTVGDVTVRLPRAVRIRLTGRLPARAAVYVDRERYEPLRRRDGSLELELRPAPGRERVRIDLLAHGHVARHREFDLERPGDVEWPVELEPASPLVMRTRGTSGELVLADPATGQPRWRGPWWFRLEAGPDGIVRESMIPPGRHVVRDLVRGVSSEPFDAPADLSLLFDVDEATPWVEGRIVAHAGIDVERAQVEAYPGGVVPVASDGGFRFRWPGPCELRARLAGRPDAAVRLERPRSDVRLALTAVAALRLRLDRPAAGGRIRARDADGRDLWIEAPEGDRFEGFPPGEYDLWIDLPGCVPIARDGVRLAEGENELPVACEPGATLRVTVDGGIPVHVSAQSLGDPGYRRRGAGVVTGLGPGRFRVTVSDRFTGLRLFDGTIESPGHGDLPLGIKLD